MESRGKALAAAIEAVGSSAHLDRLVDLIGALAPHDLITVVRYSVSERPEFVSHRNFSEAMVRRYLDAYYVHDPFYAYWRNHQKAGVVALRTWRQGAARRGSYIAGFLGESDISDEVGVLLQDGEGWCLGIFLDRSDGTYTKAQIARLEQWFPPVAALHAVDLRSRRPGFKRTAQPARRGREPIRVVNRLPATLWPALSERERQIVQLIVAGHPSATIARKLGITPGTVKNHRRHIYEKLDITTERELFLQYMDFMNGGAEK